MRIWTFDKRNEAELLEYIKNRKYYCCFCKDLQETVIRDGLQAITKYDGMICGGVEDMQIRLSEMVE